MLCLCEVCVCIICVDGRSRNLCIVLGGYLHIYLPYLPYPTLQFSRGVGKREKANGLCNPLMILFRWIFS